MTKPYLLTRRTYNTLQGRGYKLVCKICGDNLEFITAQRPDETDKEYQERKNKSMIESKPSTYHKWKCDNCKVVLHDKPERNSMLGNRWYYTCPDCGGVVYHVGRKFYHEICYEASHYGSLITVVYTLKGLIVRVVKWLQQ